jgi:hypothetical protein
MKCAIRDTELIFKHYGAPERHVGTCEACGLEHTLIKKETFRAGDLVESLIEAKDKGGPGLGEKGTVRSSELMEAYYAHGGMVTVDFDYTESGHPLAGTLIQDIFIKRVTEKEDI